MAIKEIVALVPPPAEPLEVGPVEEWKKIESALQLRLPPDLYDLCVSYGSGRLAGITIYNPFSPAYETVIARMLTIFQGLRDNLSEGAVPLPLFPTQPGLFPAGKEDNGGTIFWLVGGPPECWPLLLTDVGLEWQRFDLQITTFLAKLFRKELDCLWWDREELDELYPQLRFHPRALT